MTRFLPGLLFLGSVTLATVLGPAFDKLHTRGANSSNVLLALLGDSRKMFANQFFTMADVYFHSGYYPSMFDTKKSSGGPTHLDVESHPGSGAPEGADDDENFLTKPKNWIDRFGTNFFPTVHTHLSGENAREILPWLKLSAELDPTRVNTYVTAAYWLRTYLNKPAEAEEFLREGLKANPESAEIYLELGRVIYYGKTNLTLARNIWELALVKWARQDPEKTDPDGRLKEQILGDMARADEKMGNYKQELSDLIELEKVSHSKAAVAKLIEETKAKAEP